MKIIRNRDKREIQIAQAVEDKLDGSDYDRGHLESIAAGLSNTSAAFGRLVELMCSKGLMTATELEQFVESYQVEIVP